MVKFLLDQPQAVGEGKEKEGIKRIDSANTAISQLLYNNYYPWLLQTAFDERVFKSSLTCPTST